MTEDNKDKDFETVPFQWNVEGAGFDAGQWAPEDKTPTAKDKT